VINHRRENMILPVEE